MDFRAPPPQLPPASLPFALAHPLNSHPHPCLVALAPTPPTVTCILACIEPSPHPPNSYLHPCFFTPPPTTTCIKTASCCRVAWWSIRALSFTAGGWAGHIGRGRWGRHHIDGVWGGVSSASVQVEVHTHIIVINSSSSGVQK